MTDSPQYSDIQGNTLRLDEFFYVDFLRALREGGDWLPYLWQQHNEHRVIPTKLVMIPNALFLSWNRVAEMYVFSGMQLEEIGTALSLSERTVRRDWQFARAWLARELRHGTRP